MRPTTPAAWRGTRAFWWAYLPAPTPTQRSRWRASWGKARRWSRFSPTPANAILRPRSFKPREFDVGEARTPANDSARDGPRAGRLLGRGRFHFPAARRRRRVGRPCRGADHALADGGGRRLRAGRGSG